MFGRRDFRFIYIGFVSVKVERLLFAEQKATDYQSPDDGFIPDHRATNACTRYIEMKTAKYY